MPVTKLNKNEIVVIVSCYRAALVQFSSFTDGKKTQHNVTVPCLLPKWLTHWCPLLPYVYSWPERQECPDVKNYKWQLNLVWHSCTHMSTVGVKALK